MFKILVVEDDRDLNRTVCFFLNHSGYEATGCLNATDAYDAMYGAMFDLIVSDEPVHDRSGSGAGKSGNGSWNCRWRSRYGNDRGGISRSQLGPPERAGENYPGDPAADG